MRQPFENTKILNQGLQLNDMFRKFKMALNLLECLIGIKSWRDKLQFYIKLRGMT